MSIDKTQPAQTADQQIARALRIIEYSVSMAMGHRNEDPYGYLRTIRAAVNEALHVQAVHSTNAPSTVAAVFDIHQEDQTDDRT
jgi:hypothetical protein